MDPANVQEGYETMKKINPQEAEKYLANMQALMKEIPIKQRKQQAETEASFEKRTNALRAYRASLSPQQLQSQARMNMGPDNPAALTDPKLPRIVKPVPNFGDPKNPDRIQLIVVTIPINSLDLVTRRTTLQRTKETIDYAALKALMQ